MTDKLIPPWALRGGLLALQPGRFNAAHAKDITMPRVTPPLAPAARPPVQLAPQAPRKPAAPPTPIRTIQTPAGAVRVPADAADVRVNGAPAAAAPAPSAPAAPPAATEKAKPGP